MTEILFGIRVIKFYAWEPHFHQKVADCRKQELTHLKAIKYLDAMCVYTWAALPVVISILTFVTFVLLGHQLTAPKVGWACYLYSFRSCLIQCNLTVVCPTFLFFFLPCASFSVLPVSSLYFISSTCRYSPLWLWWEC